MGSASSRQIIIILKSPAWNKVEAKVEERKRLLDSVLGCLCFNLNFRKGRSVNRLILGAVFQVEACLARQTCRAGGKGRTWLDLPVLAFQL